MSKRKDRCSCGKAAKYALCTQFAGTHFYCKSCAKHEVDDFPNMSKYKDYQIGQLLTEIAKLKSEIKRINNLDHMRAVLAVAESIKAKS